MTSLPTRQLFGLDFVSDATIDQVVDRLLVDAASGRGRWRCVVTPNVDNVVRYHRFPVEMAVAKSAHLVLPDGMPIVWASRLLRQPLTSRLPGSDLFDRLWPRLVDDQVATVMVAPTAEVASRLAAEHPNLRCLVPPMLDIADVASVDVFLDELDRTVLEVDAAFVFIAISGTKHHPLASRWQARRSHDGLPAPIVLLVGASPEFYLGLVRRAPVWMQRAGIEWVHRLLSDPRRLAHRYLIDDASFLRIVWNEWRTVRRRSRA